MHRLQYCAMHWFSLYWTSGSAMVHLTLLQTIGEVIYTPVSRQDPREVDYIMATMWVVKCSFAAEFLPKQHFVGYQNYSTTWYWQSIIIKWNQNIDYCNIENSYYKANIACLWSAKICKNCRKHGIFYSRME